MKLKLLRPLAPLLLCSLALLTPGCKTAPAPATLQRVETAAKLAAYIGTTEYLKVHPETRVGFQLAVEALTQFETSPNVDLTTLLDIVNRLPTKELRSDRAQMFITATAILLSDWGGQLPLDKLDNLKPVAASIAAGINLGLGN